jgi:dihydroxyacetone kinase-like protein
MKKIINEPRDFVAESLAGFGLAHRDLVSVSLDPDFVSRSGGPVSGKVALLSGGGSGHEPLHAGFVGVGMLDAAVPGPVFTSPTPDPIVAAARAVDGGAGVLFIVKNYTGDVLNFETAAELAGFDGVEVRSVLIADDIAVKDSLFTAGRRGVAGTVLVEKIAGALAERGGSLDEVLAVAERVAADVRSMGVALTSPIVPHSGLPSFDIGDDEIEFGIGIHGEPGRERLPIDDANGLVERVVAALLEDRRRAPGEEVLLFVNGMGGTPIAELYLAFGSAVAALEDRGVVIARSLVGNYVTALDMQGFSITVLGLDDELTALWDAPVLTPALRWGL